MKKIILIAALLFSGAIFAFADMNCLVTFNNYTNEPLTIAQAGSGWAYTTMPNTITVMPQKQSYEYYINMLSDGAVGLYDGVQGFDIYNSNQSQDTHLEIAVTDENLFFPTVSMDDFDFGPYVLNNSNSFQCIWLNYFYNANEYMMGSAYNSNSNIPFCITTIMNSNSSITVNIYNPADIVPLNGVTNIFFYSDDYYNNTPAGFMGDSNNSGILVLNGLNGCSTIYVEQNGDFIPWGGCGQWANCSIITNIPSYFFNSDGTLNSMTVDLEDGHVWKYANGQWSQQS